MHDKLGIHLTCLNNTGSNSETVTCCFLTRIRLQLCKPVTWPPLIFGVIAGVCASGNFDWSQAGVMSRRFFNGSPNQNQIDQQLEPKKSPN